MVLGESHGAGGHHTREQTLQTDAAHELSDVVSQSEWQVTWILVEWITGGVDLISLNGFEVHRILAHTAQYSTACILTRVMSLHVFEELWQFSIPVDESTRGLTEGDLVQSGVVHLGEDI